jgi:oligosaccharide repeat unit polymerase
MMGVVSMDHSPAAPQAQQPRSFITPLTYFFAIYSYLVVLGSLAFKWYHVETLTFEAYEETFEISLLYFGAVVLGWLIAPYFGCRLAEKTLSNLCLGTSRQSLNPSTARLWSYGFLALFFASFALMMILSGVGSLWIEESRVAYQLHRRGIGVVYALTTAFLTLGAVFSYFACGNQYSQRFRMAPFVVKVLFFLVLSYFMGSKGLMLGIVLIAIVYYNGCVKRLGFWTLFGSAGLALMSISFLQILQGTAENVEETLLYGNSFHNTAEFIRRFYEFGFQGGDVLLSDFWSFVPRALVPDKPYEYGALLINKVLLPGAAEATNTPGLLPWAAAYLDFGLWGVGVFGLLVGLSYGWVYRFQTSRPQSILAFIMLIQFGGFYPLFPYIPNTVVLLVMVPVLSLGLLLGGFRPIRLGSPTPEPAKR